MQEFIVKNWMIFIEATLVAVVCLGLLIKAFLGLRKKFFDLYKKVKVKKKEYVQIITSIYDNRQNILSAFNDKTKKMKEDKVIANVENVLKDTITSYRKLSETLQKEDFDVNLQDIRDDIENLTKCILETSIAAGNRIDEEKFKALETDINALQDKNDILDKKIFELENSLKKSEERKQSLEFQIEDLKTKAGNSSTFPDELYEDLIAWRDKVLTEDEIKQSIQIMNPQIEENKTKLMNPDLKEEEKSALVNEEKTLRSREIFLNLCLEFKRISDEIEQLTNEVAALKASSQEQDGLLKEQYYILKEEYDKYKKDTEKYIEENENNKNKAYEAKLEKYMREKDALEAHLKEYEIKVKIMDEMKKERSDLKCSSLELESKLEKMTELKDFYEKEYRNLKKANSMKSVDVEQYKIMEATDENNKKVIARLKDEIRLLKAGLSPETPKESAPHGKMETLSASFQMLDQEKSPDVLRETLKRTMVDNSDLKKKLKTAEDSIKIKDAEIGKLKKEFEDMELEFQRVFEKQGMK